MSHKVVIKHYIITSLISINKPVVTNNNNLKKTQRNWMPLHSCTWKLQWLNIKFTAKETGQ